MSWADVIYRTEALIDRVTYKPGWRFIVRQDTTRTGPGRPYIQVQFDRPDAITGRPGMGRSGKKYLSEHMLDDEIARSLFGLAIATEEHECREFFRLDGRQIFGPHISLDALLEAAQHTASRPTLTALVADAGCNHPNTITKASFRDHRPGSVTVCIDCDAVLHRTGGTP